MFLITIMYFYNDEMFYIQQSLWDTTSRRRDTEFINLKKLTRH